MNIEEFKASLNLPTPPKNLTVYAEALWFAAKGNWHNAHDLIQDIEGKDASLIHAYLHRVEGDISNARYWYTRGGEKLPEIDLKTEWEKLVEQLWTS